MSTALIALGANLGLRRRTLNAAVARLREAAGDRTIRVSPWFETAPVGGPAGQQAFLNGCMWLETAMSAPELHALLHEIEAKVGRQRRIRWDARVLDLDLLLFDDLVIDSDDLTVPHPRMAFRRFVLEPATTVAGDMIHPVTGLSVGELLENLNHRPHRVAICGDEVRCRLLIDDVLQKVSADGLSSAPEWLIVEAISPDRSAQLLANPPTLLVQLDESAGQLAGLRRPALHLAGVPHDNAVVEVAAAIEAMR